MIKECLTKALQKRNSDGMKTEKQTEEQSTELYLTF